MKLSIRVPLLIVAVVLITSAAIIVSVNLLVTMNWEGVVKANFGPDVDRIESLDMGLVYPDAD